MNTWGIPDWHDPTAYGEPGKWTFDRWLWEFTRRREDYRTETMRYIELLKQFEEIRQSKHQDQTPDAKSAYITLKKTTERAWGNHFQRWGYYKPLDPRISEYPQDDLWAFPHRGVSWMEASPADVKRNRARLVPKPNELALSIDLDMPIAQQIKLVEKAAKEAQIKKHGKLVQQRRHPKKWLTYLRTLDAREAQASWREIADLLLHTAQTEQSARDTWVAANSLRFNF